MTRTYSRVPTNQSLSEAWKGARQCVPSKRDPLIRRACRHGGQVPPPSRRAVRGPRGVHTRVIGFLPGRVVLYDQRPVCVPRLAVRPLTKFTDSKILNP
jgi:hypothetical protein